MTCFQGELLVSQIRKHVIRIQKHICPEKGRSIISLGSQIANLLFAICHRAEGRGAIDYTKSQARYGIRAQHNGDCILKPGLIHPFGASLQEIAPLETLPDSRR